MAKATRPKSNTSHAEEIISRIHFARDQKVMLDYDLAELYEVPTKALNQAVKRNKIRFPEDFMFRLSAEEWNFIRSQIVTSSKQLIDFQSNGAMRSQFVTASKQSAETIRSQNATASQAQRNVTTLLMPLQNME